jgi:hypothetical protein
MSKTAGIQVHSGVWSWSTPAHAPIASRRREASALPRKILRSTGAEKSQKDRLE